LPEQAKYSSLVDYSEGTELSTNHSISYYILFHKAVSDRWRGDRLDRWGG
jgi:hypothetical protein